MLFTLFVYVTIYVVAKIVNFCEDAARYVAFEIVLDVQQHGK